MRARRYDDETDGASARTVDLVVAPDVSALVVKSVVQTLAFAGYGDMRFVVVDGGTVRVP